MGDLPARERCFVRRFGWDLFGREERDEIDAEKQDQPRAYAGDERLGAVVGEKSSG